MTHLLRRTLACTLLAGLCSAAWANDYPTVDRVLYVQECMRAHPGPHYEMVNKCSCAIDSLSEQVSFDDYTTMVTVSNAISIGGERGNEFRDNETVQAQLKRYRELQAKVKKGCFINLDAK